MIQPKVTANYLHPHEHIGVMTHPMHVNHQYVLSKAISNPQLAAPCVLDYGCGAGEVVESGRKMGLEIYGTDVFYERGHVKAEIERKGLMGFVRVIEKGIIPFPDNFFDFVISNQVFEHIQDIDGSLMEINRVLKPGGKFLCLFPSKECFIEWHGGVPFLHWFSKDSRVRFYYAFVLRGIGFGYFKDDKSISHWVSDFIEWLDKFTYYQNKSAILKIFGRYFEVSLIEHDLVTFRLNHSGMGRLAKFSQLDLVLPISSEIFRRVGGLVIFSCKPLNQTQVGNEKMG